MRIELHLAYRVDDHAWCLERDGLAVERFNTKADAVTASQLRGYRLEGMGAETHLVVHRQDGSVEDEYNYGHIEPQTP